MLRECFCVSPISPILASSLCMVFSFLWVWLWALFLHKDLLAFLLISYSLTGTTLENAGGDLDYFTAFLHRTFPNRPVRGQSLRTCSQFGTTYNSIVSFPNWFKILNFSVFEILLMIFCGKTDHLKAPRRAWIWFFSNLKTLRDIFYRVYVYFTLYYNATMCMNIYEK